MAATDVKDPNSVIIEFFRGSNQSGIDGVVATQYSLPEVYMKNGVDIGDGLYAKQGQKVGYHTMPKDGWKVLNESDQLIGITIIGTLEAATNSEVILRTDTMRFTFPAELVARVYQDRKTVWQNYDGLKERGLHPFSHSSLENK